MVGVRGRSRRDPGKIQGRSMRSRGGEGKGSRGQGVRGKGVKEVKGSRG